MPSTYAHYYFGDKIKNQLHGKIATVIEQNIEMYHIGLHGPDLFFYYKPLSNNPVNTLGFDMHNQPAADFFDMASRYFQYTSSQTPQYGQALAYIIGFLCHFALDSTCHGYIESKIHTCNITHTEIEVEFDRFLLKKNGLNPIKYSMTDHIKPSPENARIIRLFFQPLTTGQIYKSLKSMIWYHQLLVPSNRIKCCLMHSLMKLCGKYPEMHGLIMQPQEIVQCRDSCLRLEKLLDKAQTRCLALIDNYLDHIYNFEPLDRYFCQTFGPEMNWQNIPVFSYQEELQYEI